MEMTDRVAVITGGGSGIGEGLARAIHGAGARHVVVADLHATEAQRVADAIGGTGIGLDVRDEAAIVDLVETTQDRHGPIDLFVSNAGFVTSAGLEDSNDAINAMWEVHVMSHIYAARAVVPSMAARGEGYLLNTASAAGLLSQIGSLAYTITKHAAVGLAEWLAITHHHHGIGVSVLCPQAVETNILANSPDRKTRESAGDFGVAAGDGVLSPDQVAADCLAAVAEERFWVLPHPEVAGYVQFKANDIDKWLHGMRKFQTRLFGDEPLPGDALLG